MHTVFISDLHLEADRPDIAKIFLSFLETCTLQSKKLYILGDFFESWIGDDDMTSFHQKIITALKNATNKGLKIFFLHGNRDFLIGKKFLKATGCQMLSDEHVIDLFGTSTLLMHGDTLCIEDIAYQKFRKKTRNWFVQKLFLLKSLKSRRAIAAKYREASKAHVSTLPDSVMDVTPSEVIRIMQKHTVKLLIHGHTHRPAFHELDINGFPAKRIVLGAWHERGNALICHSKNSMKFIDVSEN